MTKEHAHTLLTWCGIALIAVFVPGAPFTTGAIVAWLYGTYSMLKDKP